MTIEQVILYINLTISSFVLIFIIWDHLKDDHLLTKQVQEFYNDIENLIFTYIQVQYYKTITNEEYDIADDKIIKRTRNRDNIQNDYLKRKIYENFSTYSNYLGLTLNRDDFTFLNNTIYVLSSEGLLKKRDFENNSQITIPNSYIKIENEEIDEILTYLRSLRFYWNKHHSKFLIRFKLKENIDFSELLGKIKPLERIKLRSRYYKKRT